MKREELAQWNLAPEVIDKIMALHGRDLEKHKTTAQEWQQKYDTDTAALRLQMAESTYGTAQQQTMHNLAFSSESAKKAFAAELKAAQLPVENGMLAGFDAFMEQYRESDPAAFAVPQPAKAPVAVAVRPTGSTALSLADSALRRAFGL